ncbi:sigma-54-dependent transcriptional regulator [Flammeovirga aprica]|uniref:Sigma-54-dependent Fis family transcriptional regulator n=1 Tax=Flammeovirga aprica JL-4 TaxID=694437 RepID=A0A7X9P2G0_9BACT|nr:sigma 54-interacting transcriptional regulator [Flammeovirga aprica]NME68334.1 sigma-54-dependent Fis family transcriptional regulator [Flammeovirga aprica JL-4]
MMAISSFDRTSFKFQIQITVLLLFLSSNIYDVLMDLGIIDASIYVSEYAAILSILLFNFDLITDLYKGTKHREVLFLVSSNFNKLIQEINLYVIGYNEKKEVNFVNSFSSKILGNDLLGKTFTSLFEEYEDDKADHLTLYKTVGKPFKYIKTSIITLNTESNKQTYIIGYDITEKRREQKKLRKTLQELHLLAEELEQENTFLKVESQNTKPNELFVGSFISSIEQEVKRIANHKSTVLIAGEVGTGKKYVADLIIEKSNRATKPHIVYNCHPSIKSIFQSRYYESKPNSEYQKSIMDVVNNGTLILSNIENMSDNDQEQLLSMLKEQGEKRLIYDVRFIITTTKDLLQLVRERKFNTELYQYLSIYTIHLPQLKNRREDIPYLTDYFMKQFCDQHNVDELSISMASLKKLQSYDWPENIKELRLVVQKAVLASKGKTLRLKDFEEYKMKKENETKAFLTLEGNERAYILKILNSCNWKISGKNSASEVLGVNEATLRSKMKKLSILKESKVSS